METRCVVPPLIRLPLSGTEDGGGVGRGRHSEARSMKLGRYTKFRVLITLRSSTQCCGMVISGVSTRCGPVAGSWVGQLRRSSFAAAFDIAAHYPCSYHFLPVKSILRDCYQRLVPRSGSVAGNLCDSDMGLHVAACGMRDRSY